MGVLRFVLWCLARFVLGLRYRIVMRVPDEVRTLKGPILVLPNHPAYIDPPISVMMSWPLFRPRPLLFEGNFKNPVLYPFMFLLRAIRVPDLEQSSAEARQRAAEALEDVKIALRNNENVILWPSGRLQRTGVERLGGARIVSEVMREIPEAKIVVFRTRGLWGSRFSYGFDGKKPNFFHRLFQGVWLIFANLIFFAPRRDVEITVEYIDRKRLPGLDREVLNPFLEGWYNEGGPAKPVFVPAHFLFGPRTREFPEFRGADDVDLSTLKDETRIAVNEMIAEKLNRTLSASELKPDTGLDQLGMDSLDRMDLSLAIERRFGFSGDQLATNVGQLYALAGGLTQREPPKPPPAAWVEFPERKNIAEIHGHTIADAIVHRALGHLKDPITADDRSGVLNYEKLLVGALTLSRRFATLAEPHVGVLLPASVACDVTLVALYLAGKIPVLLNWTTGPANLAHAAQVMGLKNVISSKAFVDRINVQVAGTTYLHLEEMRKDIGKFTQLMTLLRVRWLPGGVRAAIPKVDPNTPAVVLFTSGSEKAPKAVPLTHTNVLTNMRGGLAVLKPREDDIILGFLPAFHSFGMTVTGLLPLLSGIRVVRHPDPTDSAALARKIGVYKPTILVGTPTFVSYIIERAEPGELQSLRLVVVGAEKCPEGVFERMKQAAPNAAVVEGYGITECSPVVSVNPPEAFRVGTVGKPMPGVETLVVDLESGAPLSQGQRGMLLVSGPMVFPGYIAYEGESPFREIDGKRWYVTGDLVDIEDGYIRFAGRLKRFLKAGGEMISLPALEEPFARKYPATKDGPQVAVEGVELPGGGRKVVLFATIPLALREANELLQREGFHGVMRLDEVRQVPSIPVLGTGKTDYKVLRAQLT